MTSVVVVDDQTLVRQGIRSLLEVAEIEVIGEADDGRVALDVISSTDPDVVLLDLRMPDTTVSGHSTGCVSGTSRYPYSCSPRSTTMHSFSLRFVQARADTSSRTSLWSS